MVVDPREYGQHLAEMLAASHFSAEEKQAWAALVPNMTPEQLVKFDALLKADMTAQAAREQEDVAIALKAAQHKRDLSLTALSEKAHQAMDDIEAEIAKAD